MNDLSRELTPSIFQRGSGQNEIDNLICKKNGKRKHALQEEFVDKQFIEIK